MWEHPECQNFLEKLFDYGIGLHNIAQKSKDAIKIFERILQHDPPDHLVCFSFYSYHHSFLTFLLVSKTCTSSLFS